MLDSSKRERINVTVRYFAGVRDRLGIEVEDIALAGDSEATIDALWRHLCGLHPELEPMRRFLRFSVNLDFVDGDAPLAEGDEVGVIPPIAGGVDVLLKAGPLDEASLVAAVERQASGAVVTFRGVVRNHSQGRAVSHLEYEVYPEMATAKLRQVIDEVVAAHPGATLALQHRHGRLDVGDVAVFIAASAAHRAEAFDACRQAIERIKEIVPIWKKEVGPDGESWVGMGS